MFKVRDDEPDYAFAKEAAENNEPEKINMVNL